MTRDNSLNFIDNDVVLKVCQYQLETLFCANCASLESIRILPTLKFKFSLNNPSKAIKYAKSEDNLQRLNMFVDKIREADEALVSDHYLDLLQEIDQIDAGEAILFALAAQNNESITFTGDKRSIIALSKINDANLYDSIAGKVKCLEQSVAEMLVNSDTDEALQLIKGQPWDQTLRICSSGDINNMLDCLQSYYNSLATESNSILAPFPI